MLCHVRTERTRTQANEKIDLTSAINQSKIDDKDEYCGRSMTSPSIQNLHNEKSDIVSAPIVPQGGGKGPDRLFSPRPIVT